MTDSLKFSYLDVHFADFIVRINGDSCDELWWGAALVSHSTGRGHSCVNLKDVFGNISLATDLWQHRQLPTSIDAWQQALRQSCTVGAPGDYTPLVLDSAGRLYLQRCWGYEQQIASGITSRNNLAARCRTDLETALDRYFPPTSDDGDLQRTAARMALQHRFSVVSGGPGTGKTATVARILALLIDMADVVTPEIALTAPTGKAALRLHQSILRAVDKISLSDAVRDNLPTEVMTIHRLLGVQTRSGGFRHNRNNRLSCNVLVVDEASMVDLQLMASLMEALHDDARIILLGDRNQLASVEAGAVLADVCDSAEVAGIPVTQLSKSYRFHDSSGIAALSRLINSGDGAGAMALLQSGQFPDIRWRQLPGGKMFDAAFMAAAREGYAGYAATESPSDALAQLNSFKVLSPLRSGPYGIENLNRLCESACSPGHKGASRSSLIRPVMISANNYDLGLFNGDTGVVKESNGSSYTWFEEPNGGLRRISSLRLPPGEAAFALTVHKSQGSEFERVLLILPDQRPDLLCRELLYTAVTRARSHIEIWGSAPCFLQAVERRMLRTSGLVDRLSAGRQI